jgi:hypothetical protein
MGMGPPPLRFENSVVEFRPDGAALDDEEAAPRKGFTKAPAGWWGLFACCCSTPADCSSNEYCDSSCEGSGDMAIEGSKLDVGADGGSLVGVWSPPAIEGPLPLCLEEGLPSLAASPPVVIAAAALPPAGLRFVMSNADWVELVGR